MATNISDWLEQQEIGIDILSKKSSKTVSFDEFTDRVVMNRSIIEVRKQCIIDGDTDDAELCKTALINSIEKLKKVNKKKYKVSEKLETELKKVLRS